MPGGYFWQIVVTQVMPHHLTEAARFVMDAIENDTWLKNNP